MAILLAFSYTRTIRSLVVCQPIVYVLYPSATFDAFGTYQIFVILRARLCEQDDEREVRKTEKNGRRRRRVYVCGDVTHDDVSETGQKVAAMSAPSKASTRI